MQYELYKIPKLIEETVERISTGIQPYCTGQLKIQYGFDCNVHAVFSRLPSACIAIREARRGLFGLEHMVTLVEISQENPYHHLVSVRRGLLSEALTKINDEMRQFLIAAPTEDYTIFQKRFLRKALLELG